jgi:hypothetical protein
MIGEAIAVGIPELPAMRDRGNWIYGIVKRQWDRKGKRERSPRKSDSKSKIARLSSRRKAIAEDAGFLVQLRQGGLNGGKR